MAECLTPYHKIDKAKGLEYDFPCGKCPNCVARRTSQWSFRLMQEEKQSVSALFLTLTYNTKTVPITKKGFMSLDQRDVQLFMKRLRKTNQNRLKYYVVGEYGGKTKRPHYHMILFNADIKTILPAWQKGEIHYGLVSGASIGYTLKYMTKQNRGYQASWDDRNPEFANMSKCMGANYITKKMVEWHKADLENRMYCNIPDGKIIAMPRYYKDKIYTEDERAQISVNVIHKLGIEADKYYAGLTDIQINQKYQDKETSKQDAFKRMYRTIKKDKL